VVFLGAQTGIIILFACFELTHIHLCLCVCVCVCTCVYTCLCIWINCFLIAETLLYFRLFQLMASKCMLELFHTVGHFRFADRISLVPWEAGNLYIRVRLD
jgi:hypothetical protein